MNEKDSATLRGILMRPLAIGKRAVIFSQGQFIRTAPVAAIYSWDAGMVQFATLDAEYIQLLDPLTQSASNALVLTA